MRQNLSLGCSPRQAEAAARVFCVKNCWLRIGTTQSYSRGLQYETKHGFTFMMRKKKIAVFLLDIGKNC
jgi:hypothetical protein